MNDETNAIVKIGLSAALVIGAGVSGCLWGCPQYNVYSQEMEGRANLAAAQSTRQVAVLEARAKMESARSLASAEVIRAKGAAEANHILQNSLGGPEGYLRYLQIQSLDNGKPALIYVPTEGGLPATEASRLNRAAGQE